MPTPHENTLTHFRRWVRTAPAGATFIYHIGNLAADRGPDDRPVADIDALARAAWAEYEAGRVVLVQRRLNRERAYMAVRTRRTV